MYYFYIIRCCDNSLYCGQTNNLERRIKEHNSSKSKSAKYTKIRRPVRLVHNEEYSSLLLAMRREIQVKRWTKAKKEALVALNMELPKRL